MFLLTQKDEKIKALETTAETLRSKLNEAFNKTWMGEGTKSEVNPRGISNKISTASTAKKGGFDLSERLSPISQYDEDVLGKLREELAKANLNKEDWANDLKVADEQAEKLRNKLRTIRK